MIVIFVVLVYDDIFATATAVTIVALVLVIG